LGKRVKTALLIVAALAACAGSFAGGLVLANSRWVSARFHDSWLTRADHQARLEKEQRNKHWANKVIGGGYILHFRHAQREKWHDSAAFDAWELAQGIDASKSSFSRATCLTPQGVEEAKLIGNVFRSSGVKVSKVISSPSCRAWQTALHAFGSDYDVSNALLNRTAIMPEQRAEFAKSLRRLLMTVEVPTDSNVVLTGHGATLEWDGKAVIDEDTIGKRRNRMETGFFVLERSGDRIIAHYKFTSIREFANAVIELPLERRGN
jgi:broad specificity phosphatase PhoE